MRLLFITLVVCGCITLSAQPLAQEIEEKSIALKEFHRLILEDIDLFLQDPTTDEAKEASRRIVHYAENGTDIIVSLDPKALPWYGNKDIQINPRHSQILLTAYIAGNIHAQLTQGQQKSNPYAGAVGLLRVYQLLMKKKVLYEIPELEHLNKLYENGNLWSYLNVEAVKWEQGVQPEIYTEPQTGLTFPRRIGQLKRENTIVFDDPRFGTSMQYVNLEKELIADIFIYHKGYPALTDDLDSKPLKDEKMTLRLEFEQVAKLGYFKDVKLLQDTTRKLLTRKGSIEVFAENYSYLQYEDPESDAPPISSENWTYLFVWDNFFIKISLAWNTENSDNIEAINEEFLSELCGYL